ncbi:ATP/GTP-binding protein [Trueperella pyogenes]|uniref:ATP/GTP-binding protein n=1 Tax=Trueperella pyogenes TaxID=1661 RepID=UPI00345DA235
MSTAMNVPSRGWSGVGGGAQRHVPIPPEWRGTSVQVCGLWPFAVGAGAPMIGVPFGRNLRTGTTVCFDPISWFQRAALISNPSMFVLGKPGLGKSSAVRRIMLGLDGYGTHSMVLGDLKGEHIDLIRAIGGQVIEIGRGRSQLNPLDTGMAREAATLLTGQERAEMLADAHGRRLTMLTGLVQLARNEPPTDREEAILDRALAVLDERVEGVPVLRDVLEVIRQAPNEVRQVAIDHGSIDRYRQITEGLEATLMSMLSGKFGEIFAGQTTTRMKIDRSVVFDVSSIEDGDTALQAAVLLACWSYGFGTISVANALADAGVAPRRHYFVVMDELWRALRSGRGMVDRVDALTRLNRQWGTGQAMITHTMSDLDAIASEEDRAKARGFVERSGVVLCGGLPRGEMTQLTKAIPLSEKEQDMLVGWQDPPMWDSATGRESTPPGRGNFLIKVGGRPGIPVHVELTGAELSLNDTNKAWK